MLPSYILPTRAYGNGLLFGEGLLRVVHPGLGLNGQRRLRCDTGRLGSVALSRDQHQLAASRTLDALPSSPVLHVKRFPAGRILATKTDAHWRKTSKQYW